MTKKIFLITGLLLTLCSFAQAQWFVGGNTSINLRNSNYYINAAPEFGRRFVNDKLSVAISPFLSYYKIKGSKADISYGGRVYTTFLIYDGLYAIGGVQAESYQYIDDTRKWQISIPIGAGYRRCMGSLCIYAEITYDLLFNEDSYGENPLIRAGANYNF